MWLRRLTPVMRRTAAFWTDCRELINPQLIHSTASCNSPAECCWRLEPEFWRHHQTSIEQADDACSRSVHEKCCNTVLWRKSTMSFIVSDCNSSYVIITKLLFSCVDFLSLHMATMLTLGPKTRPTVVVVLKTTNRAMIRNAESGRSPTSSDTGTPAAHVITTLYTLRPMYLESLSAAMLTLRVSQARKQPNTCRHSTAN